MVRQNLANGFVAWLRRGIPLSKVCGSNPLSDVPVYLNSREFGEPQPARSNGNLGRRGLREIFVKIRSRANGFVTWLRQGSASQRVSECGSEGVRE